MKSEILRPIFRPRRLRNNKIIREMIRENHVRVQDLIYPIFIVEGNNVKEEISSMPGIYRLSLDHALEEVNKAKESGISGVLLFGIPNEKDSVGTGAYHDEGIIQRSVRAIKKQVKDILVVTDICNCEYTDHGHCGIVHNGNVLNDETLELLAKTAISHAQAGADIVAPSDMMDGRIASIRQALDQNNFYDLPIMSYSAKYSSAFYGPFREAAQSTPQFGDRKSYQMDSANSREAILEISLDLDEGADIIMVKPAMAYMDIIAKAKEISDRPIAAYNVSGEYSMVKAASFNGWIDEEKTVMEIMTGLKRAGTDIIITYHALDIAKWLK
ncbi:MAG: porphobilinogen synthase [Candidatus Sericytochromatia bacterium]|nr:porphobilinogen synthase [Candidatus Sericytochromatia bacterium]